MLLAQKETASSVANINETTKAKLKRKFDAAYMIVNAQSFFHEDEEYL